VSTSESHISTLLEPYVGPYLAKDPVKTMIEFKVPVRRFDLDGFYKKTIEFIGNSFSPEFDSTFFIVIGDPDDSWPYNVLPVRQGHLQPRTLFSKEENHNLFPVMAR